jgi:hypothetical protein
MNKDLIRRRHVIPSFNEVIGLKDMWIVLQKNKGKYFPKSKEYIQYLLNFIYVNSKGILIFIQFYF